MQFQAAFQPSAFGEKSFTMRLQKIMQKIGNLFIGLMLRSPFHAMMSKSTLLLTVTGRKSGKRYTTPVNYASVDDEVIIFSRKGRTWWRNLRGGAPVEYRLQGRKVVGRGEAFEEKAEVERGLMAYFEVVPSYAKYYGVRLDEEGRPNLDDIARTSEARVLVKLKADER
jgi:deazaflavin-dependent oxidoreductase (nitroreductase family)